MNLTLIGVLAQPPKQDVLIFVDGEKLIGQICRTTDKEVTFHSNMAGDVTVKWSKIKELHSDRKFALIEKDVNMNRHEDLSHIPQGTVSMSNQNLTINGNAAPPLTIPISDSAYLIDEPTFLKALQRPNFFENWKGAATVGVALVQATQTSQMYTSAINLVRSVPGEDWLNPENRTTVNFSSSYGELRTPDSPTVKTSIFHGDLERDEYFSPRGYAFLAAAFDHNYSLGLDLQQIYGAGVGWTVVKSADEDFDLKAQATYENQQFLTGTSNQRLFASIFSEAYNRKFSHDIQLAEQLSILPTWSNLDAYSANGSASLSIPLIKRLSLTFSALDTFLNDPEPMFRKNSFQFATGVTYTLGK